MPGFRQLPLGSGLKSVLRRAEALALVGYSDAGRCVRRIAAQAQGRDALSEAGAARGLEAIKVRKGGLRVLLNKDGWGSDRSESKALLKLAPDLDFWSGSSNRVLAAAMSGSGRSMGRPGLTRADPIHLQPSTPT